MQEDIVNRDEQLSNTAAALPTVTVLSGGVGGARMARGFERLSSIDTTVIVNVGDDSMTHGLHVSPDIDTVIYTLAGAEGPLGWGRAGDSFAANDELARFGIDNTFKLGDRDLAMKLFRTSQLAAGTSLSEITARAAEGFGIRSRVIPVTDQSLRTEIGLSDGTWISFKEYFVHRQTRDDVMDLRFSGVADATPAPGVVSSIASCQLLVIAPSNPPLSIWPILAVPGVKAAVAAHRNTVAVSPLIRGKPIKGPADRVLETLGFPAGNAGVATAYQGLISRLVIDRADEEDISGLGDLTILTAETLITDPASAEKLAEAILRP